MKNTILLFLALTACASAQPFNVPQYHRATTSAFDPYTLDSLVLRLDASVASSLTYDGSGYVSQWNDLSPLGRHATQSTAAAQPVYYADSLGGRGGVKFFGDGNTTGYDRMLFRNRASVNWTVYVVRTCEQYPAGWYLPYFLGGYRDSANSAQTWTGFGAAAPFYGAGYGHFSAITSSGRLASTEDARYTPALYTHARNGLWRNSAEPSYKAGYAADIGTIYTCVIGGRMDASPNLNYRGIIGEILVYAVEHDATTRAAVEAYLKAKWGI